MLYDNGYFVWENSKNGGIIIIHTFSKWNIHTIC